MLSYHAFYLEVAKALEAKFGPNWHKLFRFDLDMLSVTITASGISDSEMITLRKAGGGDLSNIDDVLFGRDVPPSEFKIEEGSETSNVIIEVAQKLGHPYPPQFRDNGCEFSF